MYWDIFLSEIILACLLNIFFIKYGSFIWIIEFKSYQVFEHWWQPPMDGWARNEPSKVLAWLCIRSVRREEWGSGRGGSWTRKWLNCWISFNEIKRVDAKRVGPIKFGGSCRYKGQFPGLPVVFHRGIFFRLYQDSLWPLQFIRVGSGCKLEKFTRLAFKFECAPKIPSQLCLTLFPYRNYKLYFWQLW